MKSRTVPRKCLAWRSAFAVPLIVATLCTPIMDTTIASASPSVAVDVRSACAPNSACTSFIVAVTNSSTTTLNGLSVEVLGGAVTSLQLNGYLTTLCKRNSSHSGFVCFPFSLSPGATLRASGRTAAPLVSTTHFRLYTTANGFATSTGQTVPIASSPGDPLTTPVVLGTTGPSGAGLFVGFGVAILLIAAGGIGAVALARRRRRPVKCAVELASLNNAEMALRYWETSIEAVQRDVALSPGDVQLAEKLLKAREGQRIASGLRDRCQLNVMECMTTAH